MSRAYHESLRELENIEALIGEMASLLSDVADALSDSPGRLNLRGAARPNQIHVRAKNWPTYANLWDLVSRWNTHYQRLETIWADLTESERGNLSSPSQRGSTRLTPLV